MEHGSRLPGEHLYILRMWVDDKGAWRASVKDLRSKEVRCFGSVDRLLRFMEEVRGERNERPP